MTNTELTDGLAYDVANQSLVRITDLDLGTVADQKDAMQDLIAQADGNQAAGFGDDTLCIGVVYVEATTTGTDDAKEYTMPASRITQDFDLIQQIIRVTRAAGMSDIVLNAADNNHHVEDYDD